MSKARPKEERNKRPLSKQTNKPFLLEMLIGRQRFDHAAFPHDQKTHRIAEGIGLVRSFLQQSKRCLVKIFVDPNDLDKRVVLQVSDKGQSLFFMEFAGVAQWKNSAST